MSKNKNHIISNTQPVRLLHVRKRSGLFTHEGCYTEIIIGWLIDEVLFEPKPLTSSGHCYERGYLNFLQVNDGCYAPFLIDDKGLISVIDEKYYADLTPFISVRDLVDWLNGLINDRNKP